jgi:hypothetical protein
LPKLPKFVIAKIFKPTVVFKLPILAILAFMAIQETTDPRGRAERAALNPS